MKILEYIKHPHLLIIFISIAALIYAVYSVTSTIWLDYAFTPLQNIIFGLVFFTIDVIFFTKGFIEYKKTNDRRMALFACCFLLGGLFEIVHIFYSNQGRLQLAYASLSDISYAFPAVASLFYMSKPKIEKDKHYFSRALIICLIIFAVMTFLFTHFVTREMTRYFYSLNGTEMIFSVTYFIIAIIYADARKSIGLKTFPWFSLGYFFLFLNEFSIRTLPAYTFSMHRLFVHAEMLIALPLILIGLKDLPTTEDSFNNKLKSYIMPYLYLFAMYILILLLSSDAFKVIMPSYIQFYFMLFFIILMFSDEKGSYV